MEFGCASIGSHTDAGSRSGRRSFRFEEDAEYMAYDVVAGPPLELRALFEQFWDEVR